MRQERHKVRAVLLQTQPVLQKKLEALERQVSQATQLVVVAVAVPLGQKEMVLLEALV
jgi:hypothetical protein